MTTQGLFAVLFPSECRLCGAPLLNVSRLPVCTECLDSMERMRVPACEVCGERLERQEIAAGLKICGECRLHEPVFAKALAYGSYSEGLRELVQLLKYDRVRPAANVLGRMLGEVLLELSENFESAPLVVPVPLHRSKLKQRGFNQSELIARMALKNFHVPRSDGTSEVLAMDAGALERVRETQSQTGLSAEQRRANVRGAFRVANRTAIAGKDILLIDDVFTTGTTVGECARVLRRAGARRVLVATVARALKPEHSGATFEPKQPEVTVRAMAAHA